MFYYMLVPFQNPDIYINTLRVQEPVTVATDIMVAIVCLIVYVKTKGLSKQHFSKLYRYFFLVTALSTLVSAVIGHAFLYQFGFNAKIWGWMLGIVSITFAQFASLYHVKPALSLKAFNRGWWFNFIETVIAYLLLFFFFSFTVVEVYSAIGLLLIVVPLEWMYYKKTNSVLSKYMIIGIGIAVLSIICHVLKLAYSVWFNHMDLAHIIMALSVCIMGIGVKRELKINSICNQS